MPRSRPCIYDLLQRISAISYGYVNCEKPPLSRQPRKSQIAAIVLLVALATGLCADETGLTVRVIIKDNGEFEVLHSRAKTTATGAVLFGLIGYGIEESSRVGEDNEREAQVLAFLPSEDCRTDFTEALSARLAEKGFAASVLTAENDSVIVFDYTIRLKIRACGFKLANSTSNDVSAFYAASYAIDKAGKKPSRAMTDMLITGTFRSDWTTFVAQPELAASEFESVRIHAGRRLANLLIYERR